jgi:histidinol phosphatase-like PHP family hydrolase
LIGNNGEIDLPAAAIRKLDILSVGIHPGDSFKDLGSGKNSEELIKCFKKYPVHIFTHPNLISSLIEPEKVYQAACDNNILLELNLDSLKRNYKSSHKNKGMNINDVRKMIEIVRKNKKKLIVNSDAHFLHEIGDDSILKECWDELGLSDDIIINNYPEELEKFIASKKLS